MNTLRLDPLLDTALMRRSMGSFDGGEGIMSDPSIQVLFGIGGWAPPFLGWLDPWEIVVGLVFVVLGLRFVKHVAEHWTR